MPGRGAIERKDARKRLQREEANRLAKEAIDAGLAPPPMKAVRKEELPAHALHDVEAAAAELRANPTELVWVESKPLDQLSGEEYHRSVELCHAIFSALLEYDSNSCTLQQLRANFKVAEIMKLPCFNRQRFLQILKRHPELIHVEDESGKHVGSLMVHLTRQAEKSLPGADKLAEVLLRENDEGLPVRIEEIGGPRDRVQALRIDLLRAMHRMGGAGLLQDIGQDPRVMVHKKDLQTNRKAFGLLEIFRLFSQNFAVDSSDANRISISIVSYEVSDQSAIADYLARSAGEAAEKGKGKGKKGKDMPFMWGKGGNDWGKGWDGDDWGMMGVFGQMMAEMAVTMFKGKGKGMGKSEGKGEGKRAIKGKRAESDWW